MERGVRALECRLLTMKYLSRRTKEDEGRGRWHGGFIAMPMRCRLITPGRKDAATRENASGLSTRLTDSRRWDSVSVRDAKALNRASPSFTKTTVRTAIDAEGRMVIVRKDCYAWGIDHRSVLLRLEHQTLPLGASTWYQKYGVSPSNSPQLDTGPCKRASVKRAG